MFTQSIANIFTEYLADLDPIFIPCEHVYVGNPAMYIAIISVWLLYRPLRLLNLWDKLIESYAMI